MTTKNRPGPKPKPEGTTKVRHNVMLSPSVAEAARQLGNGNLSAGLELAVKFTLDCHQSANGLIQD